MGGKNPILFVLTYKDQHTYAIVLDDNEQKQEDFTDWNVNTKYVFFGINLKKIFNNLVTAFITTTDTEEKSFSDIIPIVSKVKKLSREIERFERKTGKENS